MSSGRAARGALLVALVGVLAACAGAQAGEAPVPEGGMRVELVPPGEPPVLPEPLPQPVPEEMLSLPPVTEEMTVLLEEVRVRWGEHRDLGQSEITLDRSAVILRWYGAPPAELVALAEASGGAGFDVRIEQTRFRTTELVEEAGRLVREHAGVVHSAWPGNDGGGVGIGLDPAVAGDGGAEDLARLGISSRFPLFPEVTGAPVAVSAVG
ncbi:hypothetical protein [Blastococcus xanthinilyticus]|uniref:Peptidase S53 activation domain-containing protein n=1 Tax=Blastococcus xanthinilyticus TaxID=1564164 RepID=A0A5S5CZI2_9ACTN|nr:hypothetical protein [Blastococcus xanthinilyticus]TYP87972.1 hypothetical protein BD833_105147 [Blastococcus xanthinilyticus]